jgi:hypothetical protein
MNGFIKITVLDIDEEDIQFKINLSNNDCSTTLIFYGYVEEFKEFGQKLLDFPKSITDTVSFQLGEDNMKWAYYMLLKAFCHDGSGHTALRVIVDNLIMSAHGYRTEFSIFAEAAALNTLGHLLINWNPILTQELYWESYQS